MTDLDFNEIIIDDDTLDEITIDNDSFDDIQSNNSVSVCPICLDSEGELIESGCKVCKHNNRWIHNHCLQLLKSKNFHIYRCYICKRRLNNIIIKRDIKQRNSLKIAIIIFFLIIIFGFIMKLVIFLFLKSIRVDIPKSLSLISITPMGIFLHMVIGAISLFLRLLCFNNCNCRIHLE